MSFSATCSKFSLRGAVLSATCRDFDGNNVDSTLNLDAFIGNDDGKFNWDSAQFSLSASDVELNGVFLCASLTRRDGAVKKAALNLNFCVENMNGQLGFKRPSTKIAEGCTLWSLDSNTGKLSTLCVANDGNFHLSTIDLNEHLSNDDGKFNPDGRNFTYTARNVRLDGLVVRAELRYNEEWVEAAYDLQQCLWNGNGNLQFESHDAWYDSDGPLVRFLESLLVTGYTIAGMDDISGDTDAAMRATAQCSYYTIVFGAALLGSCFGGPVGAAVGGAFIIPAALSVKGLIGKNFEDPQLRQEVTTVALYAFIKDTLIGGVGAGVAYGVAEYVRKCLVRWIDGLDTAALEFLASLIRKGLRNFSALVTGDTVKKVLLEVSGGLNGNEDNINAIRKKYSE
ncbi:hypothetical protein SCP_0606340 [Sparassis crispa]|uniref:Cyanovirin-N domain-containing protein n=1 Tax=Sparassis crispa TaxID=139825 RepID=A0A401GR17_9APHY|nr:hypothetical protein SCP_0606340 [Sparassis crispa]GBE84655.1 hypothetical protein SCP_0606340 [Sparassis crispa]